LDDGLAQLYLLMSIIILSLLARFATERATLFIDAIFATASMPVVYTMSYYSRQARVEGDFVRCKKPSLTKLVVYELAALAASYIVGFLMFYALTGATDYYTYTAAYVASQTMRLLDTLVINVYRRLGVDPGHPFLMLIGSAAVASLHLAFLQLVL